MSKVFLHSQRRIKGSLRMVLVRQRCTEQREYPVAGGLDDIAIEETDSIHHQLECRIDNRACFLGIEVLHQLGRTFNVGEYRGYCLALALERYRRVVLLRGGKNES